MSESTGRLAELLRNFVEIAIAGGFTDKEIIKSLHADEINTAIKRAHVRRQAVTDNMREKILNQPRDVQKSEWPDLLEKLKDMTPVGGGDGTHCYDHQYDLDGKRYSVVYEYKHADPIDITVKETP